MGSQAVPLKHKRRRVRTVGLVGAVATGLVLLTLFNFRSALRTATDMRPPVQIDPEHEFFYFSYGSDMLNERMRVGLEEIELPLKVHRARISQAGVGFGAYSKVWRGGVPTIVLSSEVFTSKWSTEDISKPAYGIVRVLPNSAIKKLRKQKGLYKRNPIYEEADVEVELLDFDDVKIKAVVFKLIESKSFTTKRSSRLPTEQSKCLLIAGAEQHVLPKEYVDQLKLIETSGSSFRRKTVGDTC